MKYIVLLCDGMADYPLDALGGKTPMQVAYKPYMDALAQKARVGLVRTVAPHLKPGSDVANLSVMGYDPDFYYAGRSPLEAASIGVDMKPTDVSLRCNLVTLSEDEPYAEKTIIDYCAGDISSEEAAEIISSVQEAFGNETFRFYPGVSYRHCLIWSHGTCDVGTLTPPHDITGKVITPYLSDSTNAVPLIDMMKKSYELLKDHPVNQARVAKGLRPANSIWLWGEGVAKPLTPFTEKFGVKGTVISAVDLIKGIGKLAKMDVREVPGTTGYIDTNFEGKMQAALDALNDGSDFVYIHVEAPDECGHRFEIDNKVKSIEYIDDRILRPLLDGLEAYDDYRILILPDHPTPLALKTHTSDPVPYLIYQKSAPVKGVSCFCEMSAKETGVYVELGHTLMNTFLL